MQYILNCGPKEPVEKHHHLSCHGGSALRAYEYIHSTLGFVAEDTCLNYIACSDDSDEGWCPNAREVTSCEPWNVCRTCDGFSSGGDGGFLAGASGGGSNDGDSSGEEAERDAYGCRAIPEGSIPNVTIAEFGSIEPGNIHAIQAEIYARYTRLFARLSFGTSAS